MGDGAQGPDEFVHAQSASTGLPERMCRANMKKNAFVLTEMRNILTSLTRGLSFDVLSTGHGEERQIPISYQAQSPVLGLVLPSNSPGVHTLWLPIVPLQVGLVLKPGPQEPWTPYRMAAPSSGGIPREAIYMYPGAADVGAAVRQLRTKCLRRDGHGGPVSRNRGQAPGILKIILGDERSSWGATSCHGQACSSQRARCITVRESGHRHTARWHCDRAAARRCAAA